MHLLKQGGPPDSFKKENNWHEKITGVIKYSSHICLCLPMIDSSKAYLFINLSLQQDRVEDGRAECRHLGGVTMTEFD